ncbi:hypothetical protein BH24ACT5_BH24ACT5_15210 [soil metagenome]
MSTSLVVYIALFTLSGVPGSAVSVGLFTTIQTRSPAHAIGRVVGLMGTAEAVGSATGAIVAGSLVDRVPLRPLLNAQAAIYLATGVLAAFLIARHRALVRVTPLSRSAGQPEVPLRYEGSAMNIERVEPDVQVLPQRRTIVTALPLKSDARRRLADLLDARVVDVREPIEHPDLVLTPACSPQLIEALGTKYDGAQVVVVELDDWEFDIELSGPVKRILRSGAAAYVLADSIDELASKIAARPQSDPSEPDPPAIHELSASATFDELIAAFLRESVEYATRIRTSDS